MSFIHEMGSFAECKVTGMKGVIICRSENLNGCNRYFIQPKVEKDMKLPDGVWIDEAQVKIIEKNVAQEDDHKRGGPHSKIR